MKHFRVYVDRPGQSEEGFFKAKTAAAAIKKSGWQGAVAEEVDADAERRHKTTRQLRSDYEDEVHEIERAAQRLKGSAYENYKKEISKLDGTYVPTKSDLYESAYQVYEKAFISLSDEEQDRYGNPLHERDSSQFGPLSLGEFIQMIEIDEEFYERWWHKCCLVQPK